MSSYFQITKRPYGDKSWDAAFWIDDFFGHHAYGVRFSDGTVLKADEHKFESLKESLDIVGLAKRMWDHPDSHLFKDVVEEG